MFDDLLKPSIFPLRAVAHVTALAGGEALLPCDLSPANDSVALVLWYKDALPTPVYSVDARRGDVSQARHSSIAWGPRAYFATQPPGLRLQALAVGDSGVYRCRVDFRKDRTRNHETSLVVIGKRRPRTWRREAIKPHSGRSYFIRKTRFWQLTR